MLDSQKKQQKKKKVDINFLKAAILVLSIAVSVLVVIAVVAPVLYLNQRVIDFFSYVFSFS